MSDELIKHLRVWTGARTRKGYPHKCDITTTTTNKARNTYVIQAEEVRGKKKTGVKIQIEIAFNGVSVLTDEVIKNAMLSTL